MQGNKINIDNEKQRGKEKHRRMEIKKQKRQKRNK